MDQPTPPGTAENGPYAPDPDVDEVTPYGVYLAGPSGFSHPGMLWHTQELLPRIAAAGLVAKDPWADQNAIVDVLSSMEFGPERREALKVANLIQGRYDLRLVRESQAVLASLDGPVVDDGTAMEIGYAFARGLLIVGIKTDIRKSSDNEGSVVNLMLEVAAVDSGGIITTDLDEAVAHVATVLAARNAPGA
jgi:nucleoside 2-deoxyribosyltransferase